MANECKDVVQLLSRHVSLGSCLIVNRDCGIVIPNEYENTDQFILSQRDSFDGLFD